MANTTIPVELSSTPGIVDNSNATAITIDSSENVGIGTAVAPGINGKGLSIYDALYPRLTFRNDITGDSSAATVGTAAYLIGDDFYLFNQEPAGKMIFGAGNTERLRIQAGGGISFNGDTAAANALDDYEEGTFTPSYTVGGGGSVTGVTSTNVGAYTKVGRMCTVTVRSFYVATSGTIPTYYRVTLPFTAATITNGMTGGGFGQETGQSGAGMMIKVDSGQTSAIIWKYDGTAVPANSYFELMFTYMTA